MAGDIRQGLETSAFSNMRLCSITSGIDLGSIFSSSNILDGASGLVPDCHKVQWLTLGCNKIVGYQHLLQMVHLRSNLLFKHFRKVSQNLS
jgi:hypothetical protein